MRSNLFVHFRLCESRLINLIMPVFSESNHVKHNVLTICLPVFDCDLTTSQQRINIKLINMNHWYFKSITNSTCISTRSWVFTGCSEPNIIVCNEMNRAPNIIIRKLAQAKSFISSSLANDRWISMPLYIQHWWSTSIVFLLCSCLTHSDCILKL